MSARLLADENTSHRLVAACHRMVRDFPVAHLSEWRDGQWMGYDDDALLAECSHAGLILVGFDRATLPWHAAGRIRRGDDHGGLILFRRSVRSTDYGHQARILTEFWRQSGATWDWTNRIVYLPKSPGPIAAG